MTSGAGPFDSGDSLAQIAVDIEYRITIANISLVMRDFCLTVMPNELQSVIFERHTLRVADDLGQGAVGQYLNADAIVNSL